MISEPEGELILQQLKLTEERLCEKLDKVEKDIVDLRVANGMLFRSEAEQEQRFREIEQKFSLHAQLVGGNAGRRSGSKVATVVAGLVAIVVAVAEQIMRLN